MNLQCILNGRYRQTLIMMVAMTCLMIIGFTQSVQPLDQADLNRRALQHVSAQIQIPLTQLAMDGSETLSFPLLQVKVHAYKIRDNRTHETYSVMLDKWGQVADMQALSTTENRLYFEQFGRMDKALAEHLESRPASAEEEVIIWLKEPYYEPLPPPTQEEIRTLDDLHRYQARVYSIVPTLCAV